MLLWERRILGFSARGLMAGILASVLTVVLAFLLDRVFDNNVDVSGSIWL